MNSTSRHLLAFLPLFISIGTSTAADAAQSITTKSQARQMVRDNSPMGMYKLSQREAHAAYADAVKACRHLVVGERKPCIDEAKNNLQNDLAYASQQYNRARQMLPIPGPHAQYENARREAYAAFNEASRTCKDMDGQERNECVNNAKRRLQADLTFARNELATATNSGDVGSGESRSGR